MFVGRRASFWVGLTCSVLFVVSCKAAGPNRQNLAYNKDGVHPGEIVKQALFALPAQSEIHSEIGRTFLETIRNHLSDYSEKCASNLHSNRLHSLQIAYWITGLNYDGGIAGFVDDIQEQSGVFLTAAFVLAGPNLERFANADFGNELRKLLGEFANTPSALNEAIALWKGHLSSAGGWRYIVESERFVDPKGRLQRMDYQSSRSYLDPSGAVVAPTWEWDPELQAFTNAWGHPVANSYGLHWDRSRHFMPEAMSRDLLSVEVFEVASLDDLEPFLRKIDARDGLVDEWLRSYNAHWETQGIAPLIFLGAEHQNQRIGFAQILVEEEYNPFISQARPDDPDWITDTESEDEILLGNTYEEELQLDFIWVHPRYRSSSGNSRPGHERGWGVGTTLMQNAFVFAPGKALSITTAVDSAYSFYDSLNPSDSYQSEYYWEADNPPRF